MFTLGLSIGGQCALAEDSGAVNEKWGKPVFAYGASLSSEQKKETQELLKINNLDEVKSVSVSGQDLVKYLKDGSPDSNLYSSAKVERTDSGNGINVEIVKPENITKVTESMYKNAAITAGVTDASITIASPIKVTGESALTGIYKAYDSEGEKLDNKRMDVANDELETISGISDNNKDINGEQITQTLAEIKKEMAENKPATKEDVQKIVQDELKKANLDQVITQQQTTQLINLADKYRTNDINFDEAKKQLDDLAKESQEKAKELLDQGTKKYEELKDSGFFENIFKAIGDFFKAIADLIGGFFNWVGEQFA
ncbi:hypothetical protein AB447_208780 [Bacillus glycinifermentans]|uniref:DUF1002 domain-containing protein n=1 Tax=Bacillus glycinifermentans TaxID=1664069 RepID=A0A0T6BHX9_9BACI|nr:hypothetical protein AB447_208780 [Bacillus glycinifermentans]